VRHTDGNVWRESVTAFGGRRRGQGRTERGQGAGISRQIAV
jgi:hypothetical protein